jgi:hypothetical protein
MASLSTQILEQYIDHSNLAGIKKIMAIATRQLTSWTTMIKSQEWQKATTETAKRGDMELILNGYVNDKVLKVVYQKWGSNDKMYNQNISSSYSKSVPKQLCNA